MIEYLHAGDRINTSKPSLFPTHEQFVDSIAAPTTRSNDDVVRSISPAFNMRYFVWPGKTQPTGEPHEFFDFRVPAFTPDNEPIYLTPKITTYYGHDLLAPQGVTLIPVATLKKTQLHLITLHRLDADTSLEVTVMCWQGDNDTLHLASPLPTEDEYLGIDHAGVFGTKPADAEKRDYILARLWYGDTAVLDSDIAEIITPGKVLRA